MKKIITMNIFAGVLALSSANAASIVSGFDQRFIGANFDQATGILADEVSATQNATAQINGAVGGTFSFTNTPNGGVALQNSDANGDTGTRLQFTRDTALGGANGFTIQAVFSGNSSESTDGASGILGLSESAGFSGLFLGADPNSIVEVRGGNVDNTGNGPGFLNDFLVQNDAAVDQFGIYTLTVDPTATGSILTASIFDPLSGDTLLSTTVAGPAAGGTTIEGIGTIGGLFAGEVGNPGGAFNSQDNFNGAIADIVFYNQALTDAEVQQNIDFFTETFFVPEPSSAMLFLLGAGVFCGRRVRKA